MKLLRKIIKPLKMLKKYVKSMNFPISGDEQSRLKSKGEVKK